MVVLCYVTPSGTLFHYILLVSHESVAGSWDLMKQLPHPEHLQADKSQDVLPRSVHFAHDGKALLVTYLSHGIW